MAKHIRKRSSRKIVTTSAAKRRAPGVLKKSATKEITARTFVERLRKYQSLKERKKYERYFKFSDDNPLKDDEFIGVRMGQVFTLAKEFIDMSPEEIEKLMESGIH